MNEEQSKRATVDFLRALAERKDVRDSWVVLAEKEDWPGVCKLIEVTLELDETPSDHDLKKMHTHAERHLTDKSKEIHDMDDRIDHTCIFNGRPGGAVD
jgi:hypothetical protein